jgi:hypothetical protein
MSMQAREVQIVVTRHLRHRLAGGKPTVNFGTSLIDRPDWLTRARSTGQLAGFSGRTLLRKPYSGSAYRHPKNSDINAFGTCDHVLVARLGRDPDRS